MTRNRIALVVIGLLGVAAAGGCDGGGGSRPDYVTRKDFEEIRRQYVATHDTMLALWKATDSMNKLFAGFVTTGKFGVFPVPPPRPCPPKCEEFIKLIPPRPQPMGR